MELKGIDFAQYTVVPSPEQWERIDADGYGDFVIIGVGDLNRAKRNAQLESSLRAGKRPEGYVYLHMGSAEVQMTEAITNLDREGYDCRFLWPDIEETRGYSDAEVVASLARCVSIGEAAGYDRISKQGIYTGRWFWVPNTGDSKAFANMPLWTAYYNTDLQGNWHDEWPIDFSWYQPYGGWVGLDRPDRRDTRQYRGTYDLHGVNVDLNWRNDKWKERDDMATPESLLEAARALSREQLGELNQILGEGVVSMADVPDKAKAPTLYEEEKTQYHDKGDLSRTKLDHWLKDGRPGAEGGEGAGGGGDHTHPIPDHRHGGVEA